MPYYGHEDEDYLRLEIDYSLNMAEVEYAVCNERRYPPDW